MTSVATGERAPGQSERSGTLRARGLAALRTPAGMTAAGVVLLSFVALFWRWFEIQNKISQAHTEDWGHAYVIPIISGYLLWRHRERLAGLRARVFWPGLAPLLVGVATYYFFTVNESFSLHFAQGVAMVLTVFGIVLLLAGPAVMRVAFLPIAFLIFGVSLPEQIMGELTFHLKIIATQGSDVMLTVLGSALNFEVARAGNTLTITTATGEQHPMNVAEACSGMRMVIAFYALAGATALIACRHWWQRIATFLLAGPVALVMNMVRVTILGLLTLIDPDLAAGDAHMIIGTILLVPSLGVFLGVVWALGQIVTEEGEDSPAVSQKGAVA